MKNQKGFLVIVAGLFLLGVAVFLLALETEYLAEHPPQPVPVMAPSH